ncbi:MAG: bifunctional phosphopantothenoylcysteine decarboxylase/phosphopantothenate--cysteine ligase CoaBC [Turicibacter sp.]
MFTGKTVILGVSGGIAAYKIATLASMLKKQHCDVHVIMTENATHFITPITFETLTGNKCLTDTFDRNFPREVKHISLAKRADLVVVAPASANCIGKMANGIADDMLSTTILACTCKKILSPAMNTAMFENPIVQDNIKKLAHYGFEIVEPTVGYLACGDTGSGKMVEPSVLYEFIEKELAFKKDLQGVNVMVTAGPTQEAIDPVRYITNHSSGKMGYAIAKAAMLRGANVTLVSGQTNITPPPFVTVKSVVSAKEMFEAVKEDATHQDIIIKAAAVADYTSKSVSDQKMKKKEDELSIELTRTDDILAYLGQHRSKDQFLCGFSMETENLIENSRLKLHKKKIDMIAANNLKVEGAGFKGDTNILTLITENEERPLACMSKDQVAHELLNTILAKRQTTKD